MIVAFGNPVYDYIKTPSVTTGTRVLSGCSTNGCLALARLGHATTLVGRIGADFHERDPRWQGLRLELADDLHAKAIVAAQHVAEAGDERAPHIGSPTGVTATATWTSPSATLTG